MPGQFPPPRSLPEQVMQERTTRNTEVVRSAKIGILIRLSIVAFELVGVALIQSSALFMDAMGSLFDIASSLFLIVCIKLAGRPPDDNHPFGHGRYEPLGGLQLGLLLILVGGIMFVQQIFALTNDESVRFIDSRGWIFPFIAMVLLEMSYRFVIKTARKQNSPALAADAVHYRIDGLTSLFATVALVIAAFVPAWGLIIDHIGAVLIAVFMVVVGGQAARSNLHQLLDRVPHPAFFARIRQAAKKVEGVQETEKIRIQSYGPDAHVDIDIEVDPTLSVDVAHEISQNVRLEIQKEWPAVRDVTVHIEPYYPGDH
jgi:cation diffusion facilitator family transporter